MQAGEPIAKLFSAAPWDSFLQDPGFFAMPHRRCSVYSVIQRLEADVSPCGWSPGVNESRSQVVSAEVRLDRQAPVFRSNVGFDTPF